jgi:hypothetical protein
MLVTGVTCAPRALQWLFLPLATCFKTRLVANQESNSESVPIPFWRLWNIFGYKSAVEYQREYVEIRGVIFIFFFSLVNSNQKGSGTHASNTGSRNTAMVEAEKQKKKEKEDDDRNAAAERERASRVLLRSPSDDGSSLVEASSRGRTRGRESTGSPDMTPTKTKQHLLWSTVRFQGEGELYNHRVKTKWLHQMQSCPMERIDC